MPVKRHTVRYIQKPTGSILGREKKHNSGPNFAAENNLDIELTHVIHSIINHHQSLSPTASTSTELDAGRQRVNGALTTTNVVTNYHNEQTVYTNGTALSRRPSK